MSGITATDALVKLIVGQMIGGATSGSDAANEIISSADPKETKFGQFADQVVAGADLVGIAASTFQMFQQFLSNSTEAGALAADLATKAGILGVFVNVLSMGDTALEKGYDAIKVSTIVSTAGGVLLTAGTVAVAPEAIVALGILGAGLTIAGLTNLGTVGSNEAWLGGALDAMSEAIKPYYDSLSDTDQAAFQSSLTSAVQSSLNGGVLVPTIDSDGQISGYSMQVPISVVEQSDDSTVSYFNGGIGVVTPAPGDNSTGSVWTIPQPGSDTPATIYTDGNGNYKYNSTDSDQNSILLEKNSGDSGGAQNEEMIKTSPSGDVNATIGGTGAVTNLNNATITLATDAQANLTGTGNNVAIGNGASLVSQVPDGILGSQQGNQFTLSSGATLIDYEGNSTVADIITQAFGSTGANVSLGTGSTLDVESGSVTATLSGGTVTAAAGSQVTLSGSSNLINGSGATVNIANSGDTVSASD